jgi:hypothetical protein
MKRKEHTMKAKDYVRKYQVEMNEAKGILDLASLVNDLVGELVDEALAMGQARSHSLEPNDRIMLPVLKELDLKYRSIANKIEQLEPNGWSNMWRDRGIQL